MRIVYASLFKCMIVYYMSCSHVQGRRDGPNHDWNSLIRMSQTKIIPTKKTSTRKTEHEISIMVQKNNENNGQQRSNEYGQDFPFRTSSKHNTSINDNDNDMIVKTKK